MRLTIFALIIATTWLSAMPVAIAHELEWRGDKYDYVALTEGDSCCSNVKEECRPATEVRREGNEYVFTFLEKPRDPKNSASGTVRLPKHDAKMKWRNLNTHAKNRGITHVCVERHPWAGQWIIHCAYVPPGQMTILETPTMLRRHQGALLTGRFYFLAKPPSAP